MSCDITKIFHTIIRALETTNEDGSFKSLNQASKRSTPSDAFSFHNRATSLLANLHSLSEYIKRVQHLTGTTLGSRSKQKMHSELMNQVTSMFDQCTTLLGQLKNVSRFAEDLETTRKDNERQLLQHRSAVFDLLEEKLTELRRLRDMEVRK